MAGAGCATRGSGDRAGALPAAADLQKKQIFCKCPSCIAINHTLAYHSIQKLPLNYVFGANRFKLKPISK